jgi:formylglycine-generating enzyme required for sulfatase activity
MSNQTPALTDEQRIQHYFDVLGDCLDHCANARADEREAFLWNARRASEAIVYALAEGTDLAKQVRGQSQVFNHVAFLTSLTKLGRLHSAMTPYLEAIWAAGSLGAHTQSPERAADETTLRSCVNALAHVAEWFYRESALARKMPVEVVRAIQDLKAPTPRESARKRQEREHAAALDRMAQKEALLGAQVKDLEQQLERARTQAFSVSAPPPEPAHARSGRPVVAVASLVLGAGLGWGLSGAAPQASQPPTEAVAVRPDSPAVSRSSAPVQVPTDAPPAAPAPAPATVVAAASASPPPPKPLKCPPGTVRLTGAPPTFTKGPNRKSWGQPGTPPTISDTIDVCVDPTPVTTGSYRASLERRGLRAAALHHKAHCNLGEKADALPINCVTWAEANDYCSAMGGRLPSILEWERAVRSEPRIRPTPGTSEWVSDPFPPVVFGVKTVKRHADNHLYFDADQTIRLRSAGPNEPHLSWNRRDPSMANPAISFRCASDPQP